MSESRTSASPEAMTCWTCGASIPAADWPHAVREAADEDMRWCVNCHDRVEFSAHPLAIGNMLRFVAGLPIVPPPASHPPGGPESGPGETRLITNHAYMQSMDGRCGFLYGIGSDRERCGNTRERHAPAPPPVVSSPPEGRGLFDAPMTPEGIELQVARAIGLACCHTFADVRTMTPGPNTVTIARAVIAYLASNGINLAARTQGGPAVPPPCPKGGEHEPMAGGDARDGGPVYCRKCQTPLRSGGPAVPVYRKKPVVIEALQYRPDLDNCEQVAAFIGVPFDGCDEEDHAAAVWHIDTLEGCMEASPGDWIIRGVQGEFYPCKPDIFEQTYEPAVPPVPPVSEGRPT